MIDTCKNNNLFIVNGRYGKDRGIGASTFRDKSLIDYTICTADSFKILQDFEVMKLDPIFSDGHAALLWSIQCSVERNQENQSTLNCSNKFIWSNDSKDEFVRSIDTNKLINIQEQLEFSDFSQSNSSDIATLINGITDKIAEIFSQAASNSLKQPKGLFKRRHFDKPWFGPACKIARKRYHRARREYDSSKSTQAKRRLYNESKLYKQTMHKYIKKHKLDKIKKLRNIQSTEPKVYWKYLKSLQQNTTNTHPTLNQLYDYFKNINQSDESQQHVPNTIIENTDDILNAKISSTEISKCIKNLKNGKAPADDSILNEYIKSTKDLFLPVYEKLFNVIFDTGIMPNAWLEGIIRPIYKNKGDPKEANNYRPITILSCLGKVFTSVLNSRLTKFLDSNEIILENQAGFRKGYATTDHIFVLNALIEIIKSRKQQLFCAFIDFSQAFDSIWRVGLWRKLLFNSVNGKFFRIVTSMYDNIKSCVKFNNETSAFFASQCGVRQGENLSPMLFALYLNDLENFLLSGGVDTLNFDFFTGEFQIYLKLLILLYADDTIIFSDNKENFQKCLNEFHDYCQMWKLNINFSKTEIIIFNSKKNDNFEFKIGGHVIKIADKYKYLGVVFSRSGSFLNARKHAAEQSKKAMHLLFTRAVNLDLPIDLQLKLFDNTVLPILTYGSEIWGFENLDILERIHTHFLRRITKCRKSTPKYILYAEMGRYPIEIIIKQKMINFWARLVTGKASKLSYNMYLYMLKTPEVNSKWMNYIQSILDNSGRHGVWMTQPTTVTLSIGKTIKQNLTDQFLQSWDTELQKSSKGRNYSIYKDEIKLEKYINILNGPLLYAMIRFRTANHKFPIEIGRWHDDDLTVRKCQLCDKNDIGDEFHYLFICPIFKNERALYIDRYFYRGPNIIKYKELLQMSNTKKLVKLGKFMQTIMKIVK